MEQKKRIEVKIKSYDLPPDISQTAVNKEEKAVENVTTSKPSAEQAAPKKKFVVNIKDYDAIDEPVETPAQSQPVKTQKVSAKPARKPYELEDTVARIIREVDENKEKKEEEPAADLPQENEELSVAVAAAAESAAVEAPKENENEAIKQGTAKAAKTAGPKNAQNQKKNTQNKNKKKTKKKNKYEPKNPVARFLKKFIPWAGDSAGETIRKMAFITALIIVAACIYIIVQYFASSSNSKEKNDNLASMHDKLEAEDKDTSQSQDSTIIQDDDYIPPMLRSQQYYYDLNNDVVGWIEIENTHVDLPILQSEDNDYYLNRDIYGEDDEYGCIYIDYRCKLTHNEQSDNLVIYGHDTRTNSMFGDLDQYKPGFGTINYLKEHPVIKVNSNYYKSEYVIFAVIITNADEKDGEVWPYHNEIEFTDELDFQTFVSNAKKRSMYDTTIDVEYGEKLVTLSTCATDFEDSRLVVIGRELREGETAEDYIDSYEYNENTLYPDTWYRYRGGSYDDTDTRYDIETLFGSAE